jgi:hypothetical protein
VQIDQGLMTNFMNKVGQTEINVPLVKATA